MKKINIILTIMILLAVATAFAQTVSNVTSEQVGKAIHVSYELDKQADITLFVSTDGGNTYTQLYRVSGDVGKNVSAGHKTIVWDVLAEREKLKGDDIVFKVKAEGHYDLTFTVNGVTFKMIYVQGGSFTMGECKTKKRKRNKYYRGLAHNVTLSDFYIGETEVTQELWKAVMGDDLYFLDWDKGRGNNIPVYNMSWYKGQKFVRKLNDLTGVTFRFPTETEWEYAARGGNQSQGFAYAGSDLPDDVSWHWGNSGDYYLKGKWNYKKLEKSHGRPHPVKTKFPNELGIYDMSGNVQEWCEDWYGNYNFSERVNPKGPTSGSRKVVRGGCWEHDADWGLVEHRFGWNSPEYGNDNVGFRLVLIRH